MDTGNNNPEGQQPSGQEQQKPLFEVDGRAFNSTDEVVNKIKNADSHISTLEQEREADRKRIQELEQKLQSQGDLTSKLDEALEKLGTARQDSPAEATPSVDIEALREQLLRETSDVASQTVQQYEASKLKEQNLQTNIEAAKKVLGEQYEQKLREEGSKLGYTDTDIQKLAQGSPEVFKRMFGLNATPKETIDPNPGTQLRQPAHRVPRQEDLPDPTRAWDSHSRVAAMQKHLEAAAKRAGLKN